MTPYIICTTPRTRSNLLCEHLLRSQVAGAPHEILVQWHQKQGDMEMPCDEFFEKFQKTIGAKIMGNDFKYAVNFIDPTATKFIWLRHPDPIWQAISFLKAMKLKEQGKNGFAIMRNKPEKHDVSQITLSFDQIMKKLLRLMRDEKIWRDYFQKHQIKPLVIWYHELATRKQCDAVVKRVLDFLGITEPPKKAKYMTKHTIQSDEWNLNLYKETLSILGETCIT